MSTKISIQCRKTAEKSKFREGKLCLKYFSNRRCSILVSFYDSFVDYLGGVLKKIVKYSQNFVYNVLYHFDNFSTEKINFWNLFTAELTKVL